MADLIELPPLVGACCCPSVHAACGDNAIARKMKSVLCALEAKFPSKFVPIEIWRFMVVNEGGYGDEQVKVWVCIAQNVIAAVFDHKDRWFQSNIGVLERTDTRLVISDIYNAQPADIVVLPHALSLFVVSKMTEGGVTTLSGDAARSSFVRPARTIPGYRINGAGARIQ